MVSKTNILYALEIKKYKNMSHEIIIYTIKVVLGIDVFVDVLYCKIDGTSAIYFF